MMALQYESAIMKIKFSHQNKKALDEYTVMFREHLRLFLVAPGKYLAVIFTLLFSLYLSFSHFVENMQVERIFE